MEEEVTEKVDGTGDFRQRKGKAKEVGKIVTP